MKEGVVNCLVTAGVAAWQWWPSVAFVRHLPNQRGTGVLPLAGEFRERLGSALRYESQTGVYVTD